jgi:hypothetical protein
MVGEQDHEANTLPLESDEELEPTVEGAEAIPTPEEDVAGDAETEETNRLQHPAN